MAGSELVEVERIRERAYELWEQDGRPEGQDLDYWYRAEAELRGQGSSGLEAPSGASRSETVTAADEPSAEQVAEGRGDRKSDARKNGTAARSEGRTGAGAEYATQKKTRKKAEG